MNEERCWLAAIPGALAVVGPGGDVRFANEAFGGVLGVRVDDLAVVTSALATAVDLKDQLARTTARLRIAGRSGRFRWTPPGGAGKVFAVEVTPATGHTYLVTLSDVSRQAEMDAIHQQVREFLETMVNRLDVGVAVLDEAFRASLVNTQQIRLMARLGCDRSLFETIGEHAADIYPIFTREEWDGIYSRVIGARETVAWTKIGYPRDSPAGYYIVTVMPLDEGSLLQGAICVTEDVTRLVVLEKELIRQERLGLFSQMVLALNHEVNNPLMCILGSAESVLQTADLDKALIARVETIKANAGRIGEVASRLREMEDIHLTEYYKGGPLMLDFDRHRREQARRTASAAAEIARDATAPPTA